MSKRLIAAVFVLFCTVGTFFQVKADELSFSYDYTNLQLIVPGKTIIDFRGLKRLEGWTAIHCENGHCEAIQVSVDVKEIQDYGVVKGAEISCSTSSVFLIKGLSVNNSGNVLWLNKAHIRFSGPVGNMPSPDTTIDLTTNEGPAALVYASKKLDHQDSSLGYPSQGLSVTWVKGNAKTPLIVSDNALEGFYLVWAGDINGDGVADILTHATHVYGGGDASNDYYTLWFSSKTNGLWGLKPVANILVGEFSCADL